MTLEPITIQKHALGYVRVSTDAQTVSNQKVAISEFAAKNGYNILSWYADEGISGRVPATERAAFASMLDYVRNKPGIAAILVYEVSRIGRTFYDTIDVLRTIEHKLGVPIIACSPKEWFLQTTDKMTRQITLSMYAIFAERERDLISERTKAGLVRARAQGKICHRPLKKINTDLLVSMYKRGVRLGAIEEALGVTHQTIYSRLEKQGVITRHKRHGGYQYRSFKKSQKTKTDVKSRTKLFLELLGELGHAHAYQIRELAKKRYPNVPFRMQYIYGVSYRLKQIGKIAKDKDNKWYILGRAPA
jgi:DNA invertase Pin-like site-specific DNA recombinase